MKSIYPRLLVLVFLLFTSGSFAGEEGGGYAGSFLDWGVGAKAIAMGKAFSAIADDGTALYWNPAGLEQMESREFSAMHALIFADRTEDYLAFAYPASKFTISAGWLHFGVSDIQERDEFGELVGHFGDAENTFMLGSGTSVFSSLGFKLNLGTTVKYFYQSMYDYQATGWGVDFGSLFCLYRKGFVKNIRVAAVVQNLGAKLKWNTESNHEDKVPATVRLSSAINLNSIPVNFALDLGKQRDRDLRIHLGAEYWWRVLALRAGLNHRQFTAGAGFVFKLSEFDFVIDYAFTDDEISNKGLHFFSLNFRL